MTVPVRWGILGASRFALSDMAPAIHATPGHILAALATRDRARADPFMRLVPGLRVHDGYDAVLADPEVDAIYLPLPNALHVPWAIRALEVGKHVLVEKPVALSEAELAPLIAARDRSGFVATEAFMIAHHPQWALVRDLLRGGAVGRLRHVEGVFTYDNADDPANVRNLAALGGGGLPDVGVYTIGATRLATGAEPERITHADIDWEAGCDVVARVSARFPDFSAHWVNSMRMHREQMMTFHGQTGVIRLTAPFNPLRFGEATVEWWGREGERRVRRWPSFNQYAAQVDAFGAAMRGTPLPWTLEDAAGTQRVIDMAYAAAGRAPRRPGENGNT